MRSEITPGQTWTLAGITAQKDRVILAGEYALVVVTMLAALALRAYKLGEWSFWGDEIITVRRALRVLDTPVLDRSVSLLTTNLFMSMGGVSEWSARAEAALVGVLTVPVVYVLARKMFGPAVGVAASLLLSISPWHLYWSQNARFYTALLLFFTLALFAFHFALEENRRRYLVLSAVCFGLALQERMVAAVLLPILGAYIAALVVLRWPRPPGLRARRLVVYFGVCALMLARFVSVNAAVRDPDQYQTAFGFTNTSPFWILGGVAFYLGLPLLCAAAAGSVHLLQQKRREGLLLILGGSLPLLAIMAVALLQYAANRYVFVALTSVIILGAVGARELLWRAPRGLRPVAIAFAAILLLAPMGDNLLYFQYQNGNRDNWKGAYAVIAAHRQPGDVVVATQHELAEYYLGERALRLQQLDIEAYAENAPRTWFVVDLTTRPRAPQAYHWIVANAHLVAALDVSVSARTFPMRVYLYDPDQPPVTRGSPATAQP